MTKYQRKVKIIFLYILCISVSTGTFFHFFQNKVPVDVLKHQKTFIPNVKQARINDLKEIKNKLINNQISISQFNTMFEETIKNSDLREKEYYKKKKLLVKKHTLFNFSTERKFTFMFFLILLGLTNGLIALIANNNKNESFKPHINKALFFTSSISLFWMSWVFLNNIINQNNLIYLILFIVASLISTYLVTSLIKRVLSEKIKIKTLVDFILRIRGKHYPEIGSKALYAEIHDRSLKNGKTVDESSDEFEDDFINTLEKIVD
ncbi:hypothetical protein [uncultured Tenacibaculum sp.]|uniref:hypothetical protein n=1 Tax=uncultured Tenacibaculum sp. TaxID=174713 RepID=UPI002619A63A|nr:hypothetical protein [uncultured Tenacibaculum sp.]